jgi:hypothetical protein
MKICVLNGSPRGRDSIPCTFRNHGFCDFPQNNYSRRIRTTIMSRVPAFPATRKQAQQEMEQHVAAPFAAVFTDSPVLKKKPQEREG